jgi:hypothetical protein
LAQLGPPRQLLGVGLGLQGVAELGAATCGSLAPHLLLLFHDHLLYLFVLFIYLFICFYPPSLGIRSTQIKKFFVIFVKD